MYFTRAGMEAAQNNKIDEALVLYQYAYALDPDNLAAALQVGRGNLAITDETDSVRVDRSIGLMRKYVDAYPQDLDEADYYSYVCSMAGLNDEAIRVLQRTYDFDPQRTELLPRLSMLYMQADRMDSAISMLNHYTDIEGYQPTIVMRKGLLYMVQGDTTKAINTIGEVIEANPLAPEGYLAKAAFMDAIGMPDSTLHYLLRAEAIEPGSGATKVALAQYYDARGDSARYEQKLAEALLQEDLDISDKLELLGDYIEPVIKEKQSTATADKLLSELRDQYPHEADIQDFAARYSFVKGDPESAAENIRIAIDMDPDNIVYRRQLMMYLISGGNFDEVTTKTFEQLPDSMKQDRLLLHFMATSYYGNKRFDKVIEYAGKEIEVIAPGVNPSDTLDMRLITGPALKNLSVLSDIYTIMGDAYVQTQDYYNAFLAYDNALQLEPDNALTLNNYAYFITLHGTDLDKARRLSETAILLERDNPTYLDTYAWILYQQKDYEKALEQQKEAITIAEEHPDYISAELYDHLGDIYFRMNQPEDALQAWKKALELEPDNKEIAEKIKEERINDE